MIRVLVTLVLAIAIAPWASAAEPLALTKAQRVEGVWSIWEQVDRVFPLRDRLSGFRQSVDRAAHDVETMDSLAEYCAALERLVATLHDGHTFVRVPHGAAYQRSKPGLGLAWVDSEVTVAWVVGHLAEEFPLGSVLKEVDGRDPMQVAADRAQRVSASTEHVRLHAAVSRILEGQSGSRVTLRFVTPTGELRTGQLERGAPWPEGSQILQLNGAAAERTQYKAFDAGGITYFAMRDMADRSVYAAFAAHLSEIQKSRAIIFDVRGNSGGDSEIGYEVLSHFLTRPVAEGSTRMTLAALSKQDSSARSGGETRLADGLFEVQQSVLHPRPDAQRVAIPMVILTNHGTVSAAEDFVSLASAVGAQRVGETTAGSTGEMVRSSLPGGGTLFLLSKWDRAASGEEFVGRGFAPHVPCRPTLKDLLAGRDPVLHKGLEVARRLLDQHQ